MHLSETLFNLKADEIIAFARSNHIIFERGNPHACAVGVIAQFLGHENYFCFKNTACDHGLLCYIKAIEWAFETNEDNDYTYREIKDIHPNVNREHFDQFFALGRRLLKEVSP